MQAHSTMLHWPRETGRQIHFMKQNTSHRIGCNWNRICFQFPTHPPCPPSQNICPPDTHPHAFCQTQCACVCLHGVRPRYPQLAARRLWPPTAWFRSSLHTLYVLYIRFCCSACVLYVKKKFKKNCVWHFWHSLWKHYVRDVRQLKVKQNRKKYTAKCITFVCQPFVAEIIINEYVNNILGRWNIDSAYSCPWCLTFCGVDGEIHMNIPS